MKDWMRKIFGGNDPEPSRREGDAAQAGSGRPTARDGGSHPGTGREHGAVQQRPVGGRTGAASPSARVTPPQEEGTTTAPSSPSLPGRSAEVTAPLTLERLEACLAAMDYTVSRHEDEDHVCLLGTWDDYPFVIEVPEGHPGWLLVSGDWEEPASPGERDELAASVNDWNRDKFFPTVAIIDGPAGSFVRATYLTDLRAGVTDGQLRLHVDTALASCIQALSHVGPVLPEL